MGEAGIGFMPGTLLDSEICFFLAERVKKYSQKNFETEMRNYCDFSRRF